MIGRVVRSPKRVCVISMYIPRIAVHQMHPRSSSRAPRSHVTRTLPYLAPHLGGWGTTFLPPTSPQSVLKTVPPLSVKLFIIALFPSSPRSP